MSIFARNDAEGKTEGDGGAPYTCPAHKKEYPCGVSESSKTFPFSGEVILILSAPRAEGQTGAHRRNTIIQNKNNL